MVHIGVALAGEPPEHVGRADPRKYLVRDRGMRADMGPERALDRGGDRLSALDEQRVVPVVPPVDGRRSRRDRVGITAISRTPASSQPSDRYNDVVAGYKADNG
jgi:hypothetical protein